MMNKEFNEIRLDEMEQRIATLETRLNNYDKIFKKLAINFNLTTNEFNKNKHTYKKLTNEMLDLCYKYGKKIYEEKLSDIRNIALEIETKTGMNKNTAIMYVYGVKNMIEGSEYKRALSAKAVKKYFDMIKVDYGKNGLNNAIKSTKKYISYREKFGYPVQAFIKLCREYEEKK